MADYEPVIARLNDAQIHIVAALAGIEALRRCTFCRCECSGCASDSHDVERDPHCVEECFECGCSGVTDMADDPSPVAVDAGLLTLAARAVLEAADDGDARTLTVSWALDALRAALAGNHNEVRRLIDVYGKAPREVRLAYRPGDGYEV